MGNADPGGERDARVAGLREVFGQCHDQKCALFAHSGQEECAYSAFDCVQESLPIPLMHKHLRAWRLQNRLTLVKVAETLGTTHSTLLRWEKGEISVPRKMVVRLAEIYGCTPAELEYNPVERARGQLVHAAIELAQSLPEDKAKAWLEAGRAMKPPGK